MSASKRENQSVPKEEKEVTQDTKNEGVIKEVEAKEENKKVEQKASKTPKKKTKKKQNSTTKKDETKKEDKVEDTKKEETEQEVEVKEEKESDKKEEQEQSENIVENKEEKINEENKELKVKENTDIIPIPKKEETEEKKLENKKRTLIIYGCTIGIIILVILFSTVFAIFNIGSKTIAKGIKIKNTDVSGLTIEEAQNKINEIVEVELLNEIVLKYGNSYEITLSPEQIEFKYDITETIDKAYSIGRDGNLVENNYKLLYSNLFGKDIRLNYNYNETFLNDFIDDVNSKIPGLVVNPTYYIEDENLMIDRGTDGIEVEKEKLKEKIINSILERNYSKIIAQENDFVLEIPVKNVKTQDIDINKIYSEVRREPKDAYFETNPYKIYTDEDGIEFAISLEEASNIISSEFKEEYSIPLKITKASKTINDLGTEAFPYEISTFSTRYDASNINRSGNLLIAANKINGKVLMPGEVFSFNQVVGKRTVEEGYKNAKIYADGGVVDGLAGGICQISSTLYNAVLLANLEIVERRNHSYPTSYLSVGRDATVVYGAIDFQFRNSRSYPIRITASVNGGIAEFKIHGIQEENEFEINILPVTTSSIPYGTSYVQDPTLAPGQQVVSQSGHAGYKVTTYIEKKLNGQVVSKEVLSNDTYSPMRTIVRIGPDVPIQ